MHTKGKLQFLLSEVLNRSADFKSSHQAPRGSREVKVKSPTLRRSSENQAIESSGSAAKSRGLGLGHEFRQSRWEAGMTTRDQGK